MQTGACMSYLLVMPALLPMVNILGNIIPPAIILPGNQLEYLMSIKFYTLPGVKAFLSRTVISQK